jgi:hypothetical protein
MQNHCLSDVNIENLTGVCSVCGPTKIKTKGKDKNGRYKCRCIVKEREYRHRWLKTDAGKECKRRAQRKRQKRLGNKPAPYRKFVKPYCERCGYQAVDVGIIDGHHKDGNHKNNSQDNIESLCPMCNRMVHLGFENLIKPYVRTVVLDNAANVPDDGKDRLIAQLKSKIKEYEQMYA